MKTIKLVTGLLVVTLLSACGSTLAPNPSASVTTESTTCPDASGPISGPIVFGGDNNLLAMAANGGQVQQVTHVTEGSYAFEPAWSPDGRTLAYTLSSPATEETFNGMLVSMICGIDRTTGKGSDLARGTEPGESLAEATWAANGTSLVVTRRQLQLDSEQSITGETTSIAQYDLEAKTMQLLVKDGFSATLSPDGQRLAFLQVNVEGLGTHLMVAHPDGSAASQVPSPEPPLAQIGTPRWSPDSQRIAFIGTASISNTTGQRQAGASYRSIVDWLLGVSVARAHGLTAEVWIVDAVGDIPRQLTNALLDDPRVAWSPDGSQLAYTMGTGGVVLLDFASGKTQQLTTKGNYGGISWAPR